jgi:hypothetical protein
LTLCLFAGVRADAPGQPLFSQDFDTLPDGKPPQDLLVLAGNFHIISIDNGKALQVDPNPLDSFGLLFGPAELATGTVSARVRATNTGKRFPEFGVGALGPSGYKLWLMPATSQLQIKAGDQVLTHVPYEWKSGTWTWMKLQLAKTPEGKFKVQGKAWAQGKEEPKDWTIAVEAPAAPKPGRASVWATPYSGTSVQFDDLQITP